VYYLYNGIEYNQPVLIVVREPFYENGNKVAHIVKWLTKNFDTHAVQIKIEENSPLIRIPEPSQLLKDLL